MALRAVHASWNQWPSREALTVSVTWAVLGIRSRHARPERKPYPWQDEEEIHRVEKHRVSSAWERRRARRFSSIVPLSVRHACALLTVVRSSTVRM